MEKFSRYKDNQNRLLIVLSKWHTIIEGVPTPTTIDILIADEERSVSYKVTEFESWIDRGMINRVNF
jgi:hypothetical protein